MDEEECGEEMTIEGTKREASVDGETENGEIVDEMSCVNDEGGLMEDKDGSFCGGREA